MRPDPKRAAFNAAATASSRIARLTMDGNLLRAERDQARSEVEELKREVEKERNSRYEIPDLRL